MKWLVRIGCGIIGLTLLCCMGGMLRQAITRPTDGVIASTDYDSHHFEIYRTVSESSCSDCLDYDLFNFFPSYTITDYVRQCDDSGNCIQSSCLDSVIECDGFEQRDGQLFVKRGNDLFSIAVMHELTEAPRPHTASLTLNSLEVITADNIDRLEPIGSYTLPAQSAGWRDSNFAFDTRQAGDWLWLDFDTLNSLDILTGLSTPIWQAVGDTFSNARYFTQNDSPALYANSDDIWVVSVLTSNPSDMAVWRLNDDGTLSHQLDLPEATLPFIHDPLGRHVGILSGGDSPDTSYQLDVWDIKNQQQIAHRIIEPPPTGTAYFMNPTQPIMALWDNHQWGLWNWETDTIQRPSIGDAHPVGFSQSGDLLYFVGRGYIGAWNLDTQAIIESPPLAEYDRVEGLGGNLVTMIRRPEKVDFANIATGRILTSLYLKTRTGAFIGNQSSVQLSPDGKFLAVRADDTVYFWGVVLGE